MTPQPHRGMEHCKDASVVIKGDGVAWIKCDKVVGDCLWVIANGKCPNKSRPAPAAQEPLASKAYQAGIECGREEAAIDAATIRNQTLDDFLKEIKGDVDPALDYIDLDSIEAAYIRLRHQSTEGGDE